MAGFRSRQKAHFTVRLFCDGRKKAADALRLSETGFVIPAKAGIQKMRRTGHRPSPV
jgi:hypothetical protein